MAVSVESTIVNFRDVGVSTSHNPDGIHYIQEKLLTRSAMLDNMTLQQVNDFIETYHTRTILDLRTSIEGKAGAAVDSLFPTTVTKNIDTSPVLDEKVPRQKVRINFVGYNFRRYFVFAAASFLMKIQLVFMLIFCQQQRASYMVSKHILKPLGLPTLYKNMITYCPSELLQALMVFTNANNYPIHVQCSVGKDRTGLVVFFVLSICGVPEEIIVQDYAKTQAGLKPVYDEFLTEIQNAGLSEEFLDASPKNMRGLIDFIKNKYGSIENYLVKVVGLSLENQKLIRDNLCV